jgi:hypothetical protein
MKSVPARPIKQINKATRVKQTQRARLSRHKAYTALREKEDNTRFVQGNIRRRRVVGGGRDKTPEVKVRANRGERWARRIPISTRGVKGS